MTKTNDPVFSPRIARKILYRLLPFDERESLIGDFDELFLDILKIHNRPAARLWYWGQVLLLLPRSVYDLMMWRMTMLKNYLKIAIRNMRRNKGYTFINISGLAIGLASCFFILLWVQNELSFDHFHENADRICRINIRLPRSSGDLVSAYSTSALGPTFKEEFPEVVEATRFKIVVDKKILVSYGNKNFLEEKFGIADPSIFKVFTFPFIKGNPETALSHPDSIVITENFSQKYFGGEEPLGKILTVEKEHKFIITGLIKNIPHHSHLQFDSLVPFTENIRTFMPVYGSPNSFSLHFFRNYLLLKEGTSLLDFSDKIHNYLIKRDPEDTVTLSLQPLTKIHLYSGHIRDLYPRGNIQYVTIFSLIGFFILMIACINFINLTTARAASRAKEVGIRKVIGAERKSLIRQFFGESLLYAFLALVLALGIVLVLHPLFVSLVGRHISLNFTQNLTLLGGISVITLAAAVLSGSYPALFLSSFKPVKVLKGVHGAEKGKKFFRRILVVSQFTIAIGLIITTSVIYMQFKYLQKKNLGFDKEHMVYFRMEGEMKKKHEIFREELLKNPGIAKATVTSSILTRGRYVTTIFNWQGKDPGIDATASQADYVSVDKHFIDAFGMEIVQGRNFSDDALKKPLSEIIINEAAFKIMNVESPLGLKADLMNNNFRGTIIGVVKDYNFKSLHNNITPLIMWVNPYLFKYMFLKIHPDNLIETLHFVEKKCREFEPQFPFEYHFLDEAFEQLYDAEAKMGKLFNGFTMLVLFIACLGLFGLASYTVESRTKEIGIRKILGASSPYIVGILSREFIGFIFLANIVAWPVSFFFMQNWLKNFAYKIHISILIFFAAGFAAVLISLLTVSYQTVKAASANPVDSLRYE
ncbi:MAG: ABC transporter permease [Candidatus Aminicenantes bacterium]|nr:ABC transporter permease [Candidatus Aminicenantes bacterium]